MICFEEALKHNPKDTAAMLAISEIHLSMANFVGAEAKLTELLHIDNDHAEALYLMADVYRIRHEFGMHGNQGRREETTKMVGDVVHFYRRALEVNPEDDITYASLGSYYLSLGDFENAVLTFQDGLRIKPDSNPILLGLADTYKHKEEYETCLHWAQRALLQDKKLAHSYAVIGECALFANQPERAVHALEKACLLQTGEHHFLHLLITAVRSNVSMRAADALTVLKKIDLVTYHDEDILAMFHELMTELSERMDREL